MADFKRTGKVTKIGIAVDNLLDSLDLKDKLRNVRNIQRWKDVAGSLIADHTVARKIEDGILYIDVENAAWLQEISMLKKVILKKYERINGGKIVKDIKLNNTGHVFDK